MIKFCLLLTLTIISQCAMSESTITLNALFKHPNSVIGEHVVNNLYKRKQFDHGGMALKRARYYSQSDTISVIYVLTPALKSEIVQYARESNIAAEIIMISSIIVIVCDNGLFFQKLFDRGFKLNYTIENPDWTKYTQFMIQKDICDN